MESRAGGRTTAEVVIIILWWRSFASDRVLTARYERDGRVKKDLAEAREKIEATLELCKLSTIRTPYDTPRRVCEPAAVAHFQF